ncbi:GntR family transcriptional regulator [Streptomyces sp. NPDC046821]|uniref:GntR family transcriptional regulator n=1 Tax=Streptomyces sp. NPDC046821 TaxID=3154702 RepID=UPI003407ECBD
MPLGAVHQPLRDQIRDELRRRITAGTLKPGDRLVEREIAEELAVSRIPVREAIRMLETEGFVAAVARRGAMVREFTREEVGHLFDIRAALEPLTCRRAAENATPDGVRRLRASLERAKRAIGGDDGTEAGPANESFHDLLVLLSGNETLKGILDPLQGRLHWQLRQYNDPVQIWDEHHAMCLAIEARDPEAAAAAAFDHVEKNQARALHVLFGARTDVQALRLE